MQATDFNKNLVEAIKSRSACFDDFIKRRKKNDNGLAEK
jgi:hypothetical protein